MKTNVFLRLFSEWQRSIDENPLFLPYMGDKSSNQDWPDISENTLRQRHIKPLKMLKATPEKLSKSAESQIIRIQL